MNNTQNDEYNPRRKKRGHALFWIIFIEVVLVLAGVAALIVMQQDISRDQDRSTDEEKATIEYEEETEADQNALYVPEPDISQQLLTINAWSRPGKKIKSLNYIVIHYLGNPMTTAQENHDYFESLKDLQDTSMSANYVIGLEGEIIHCVPDDEVAYASNSANSYSISIENCHPDETGRFTQETYNSLVHLTAYLSEKYGLDRDQIIRHYDVTGKDCPKYFVEHEDAWEQFLDDVFDYREECKAQAIARLEAQQEAVPVETEFAQFLEEIAQTESPDEP